MVLVRTDRNGTEYYEEMINCFKCNGEGYVRGFEHIHSGVCFACKGSGKTVKKYKIYTEEYGAKIEAKRQEKLDIEIEKRRKVAEKEEQEREQKLEQGRIKREALEEKWKAEKEKSEFVGEPKQKMVRDVTVKNLSSYESQWGWVNYYRLIDDEGNSFIWKTNGFLDGKERIKDQPYVYGKGDKVKIKFTVKEHKVYQNEKITYITRVKVVEESLV